MISKAKKNFKNELTTIKVNVDQNFKDQLLKLDDKLTTLCRMQKLERQFGGNSDPPRPSPIKLERVKAIRFSGKPHDFAMLKHEFNEIIVLRINPS